MEAIHKKCGIPPGDQRLLYGSKELEEKKDRIVFTKLQSYGIVNNSTIMLVVRLPGGIYLE